MVVTMEKAEASDNQETNSQGTNTKKQRVCQVLLLNGQEFRCDVAKQANGSDLLKQIFDLLNIVECDYFGLYFMDLSDQKYWLEPNKSIKKQVKNGPWSFYFSVKFYPPDPAQLQEDITRYYMVLQIRDDIVGGRLPCSFVTHALLGSFVIQSQLGDYERGEMRGNYVKEFSFAPNQTKKLEERIMELHKTHKGQTPEQAERNYLENAKKLSLYGVDLHASQDSDAIDLFIGISWNGILIYRDGTLINRFAWPRIIKLSYVRSKFYVTVRPLDGDDQLSMIGFRMPNHRAAKTVWKSGVEHHAFFRLVHADSPRRSGLVRVGSKFRYRGRTQQESRLAMSKEEYRPSPAVVRTNSRRLRSVSGEPSPAKAVLMPVQEEESVDETPPPLPEKTRRKQQVAEIVTETVVTTTETVEVEEIQTTEAEPEQKVDHLSTSSSDHDEEDKYSEPPDLMLTEHQKAVHKLKLEFLESNSPRKAGSLDSLDAIDARLSPRKTLERANEQSTSKGSDAGTTEFVTTTTTETVIVTTYEEKPEDASPTSSSSSSSGARSRDEELLKPNPDAPEFSSNVSTISSEDAAEREKSDVLEDVDSPNTSTTSSKESNPVPIVTSPEDRRSPSLSSEEVEEVPCANHVAQAEETSNYIVSAPEEAEEGGDPSNHVGSLIEDPIQLATVETRTVRVEEVLIPKDDNTIHCVSLVADADVAPRTEASSVSSLSSDSSHEVPEQIQQFQEPPTVKTEAVVVDPYVEEAPEGTTNPPMVQTELKTITYESTKPATLEENQPQLISSQIISSETEHSVTTTEITKIVHGDISETRVEKQMVVIGGAEVDHNKVMADMILDAQRNSPNANITKVVVHEERSVVPNDQL